MPEKEEKIKNLLSMAQKAGKLASGTFAASEALKKKKAFLIIIATDAKNKIEWQEKAKSQGITSHEIFTKEVLGSIIGKENIAIIIVLDKGFARALEERIEDVPCK